MADEQPVAASVDAAPSAPAPEAPPPSPAPESPAPAAPAAPESAPDERTAPAADLWTAMLDQSGGPREAVEAVPTPDRARPEPRPMLPPPPPRPGPEPAPPPKRWAGRYQTPEELETAYTEVETARASAESERKNAIEHAQRMDRLLQAAMGPRPQPPQPPPGMDPGQWQRQQEAAQRPPQLQQALQVAREEHERIALGDPAGDPLRLERARAIIQAYDPETRRVYADVALTEYAQQQERQQHLQTVQSKFFETYPDLKTAHPADLRSVAIETEATLRQTRGDYGSPAYMQAWFDETAKQARSRLRLGAATVTAPSSSPPVRPQPAPPAARPRSGAPFAESPTPRPQEPAVSGQEVHLARVFGRGSG